VLKTHIKVEMSKEEEEEEKEEEEDNNSSALVFSLLHIPSNQPLYHKGISPTVVKTELLPPSPK
jgi:hypothetical protein